MERPRKYATPAEKQKAYRSRKSGKPIQRAYFNSGGALKNLIHLLSLHPSLIRISSAFFDISALRIVLSYIEGQFELRLMIGFHDRLRADSSIQPVFDEIRRAIRNGLADDVLPTAKLIYAAVNGGTLVFKAFQAKYNERLHAKMYFADEKAVLLGSANFSSSGLQRNIEGTYYIENAKEVAALVEDFDNYWALAEDITDKVKTILSRQLDQPPMSPYEFYLLCLHHLYPKPEKSSTSSRNFHLTDYQTHVVIMARQLLEEQHQAIVIAPTGTGKTVMGCRIALELRELGIIHRAVVICPGNLVAKWERHFAAFGLGRDVYGIEQMSQPRAFEPDSYIQTVLQNLGKKTLLIIDECHNSRNLYGRDSKTGRRRIAKGVSQLLAIQKRPEHPISIGFTATPYSKDWADLETQLAIVGRNTSVKRAEDLEGEPILHITLPFIVQQYAKKDEIGLYLDFGKNKWRFSNIDIQPQIIFDFPYPELITELDQLVFEFRVEARNSLSTLPMFELLDSEDVDDSEGESESEIVDVLEDIDSHELSRPLDEARIMRSRMWSPTMLKSAFSSIQALHPTILKFIEMSDKCINRDEVKSRLERMKLVAENALQRPDDKAERLLDLLRGIPTKEKVLIFCERRATVEYLADLIRPIRADVSMVVGGTKGKARRAEIVKHFSPISNGASNLKGSEKEINTLVATNCISEGLDFQDADHLVNYDLPWTPLTLVQRLGRLDRPTEFHRTFKVHNFVPPRDISEIAFRLHERLKNGTDVYWDMERINLLEEDVRTGDSLATIDPGFIKLFIEARDFSTIKDELDKLVPIPITRRLADFAKLTSAKRKEYDDLPSRLRTAMKAKDRSGFFILFTHGSETNALLVDGKGEPYLDLWAETSTILLNQIACAPAEPLLPIPEQIDHIVSKALREWADRKGIASEEITEIGCCALIGDV